MIYNEFKKINTKVLLVCTAVVMLSGAGCSGKAGADSKADDAKDNLRTVEFVLSSTRDIEDYKIYTGGLKASAEVTLYPLLSERIIKFDVEEGGEVRTGQIIAQIRAAGLRQTRAQTHAQIDALDETLANQEREIERSKNLYENKIITQQTFAQLQSSYRTNLAQRRAMEASVGQVNVTAQNATIRAPFDGVLVNKRLEEGDVASPAMPLGTVMQLNPLKLELAIIERDLAVIRNGMKVEIFVDAYPDKVFEGEITKILPALDQATRTNEAWVEIPNPVDENLAEPLLKPGMFVRARIITEVRPGAVVVPQRALKVDIEGRPGIRTVMVLKENNIVEEKVVQVGSFSGDYAEILSGLEADEKVLVRGQYGVADGSKVRVISVDKAEKAQSKKVEK